jgi:hypothetical protein
MESLLLQQLGQVEATSRRLTGGLAEQLGGGGGMDLKAFNLKRGLVDHEVAAGLATALLRVTGEQGRRAAEIMKA